jgi:uncharacterized Rmd1/YagE family protein
MDFNTSRANHHNRNQFQTSPASKVKNDTSGCCETSYFQQSLYVNTANTYKIGQLMTDAQSPHELATDYESEGSAVQEVAEGQISVESLLKMKMFRMPFKGTVQNITGWHSAAKAKAVTIALCKWPTSSSVGAVGAITPDVIHEFSSNTSADYDAVIEIDETTINSASFNEGDMLFFMVKADDTGNSFIHLQVKYTDELSF